MTDLNPGDFHNDLGAYGKCVRCFKSYDFPSTCVGNRQEVAEAPADSDSSNDSGSDTDDSVDQSQARNTLVFPFKLKPSPLAGATGPDWGPADYRHPSEMA